MNTTLTQQSPRPAAEIQRQLADLAGVKQAAEAYGTPDPASQAGMTSLLAHEQELKAELRAAELLASNCDAEIVLDGDPVQGHAVQAGFLGSFLESLQNVVNAVAQVMTSEPTARAAIPRNIIAENRLMVVAGFESSFGLRLRVPSQEELGQMFETMSASVLKQVCQTLSEEGFGEETIRLISHSRVKKHYGDLLNLTAKAGATVCVRTRAYPYGVRLTSKQARERADWLELLQTREEETTFSGILVGGSIQSARFELKVGEEVFRGKVSERALEQMHQARFGDEVTATVKVITATHEEAAIEPTTSYFLTSLVLPGQPASPLASGRLES